MQVREYVPEREISIGSGMPPGRNLGQAPSLNADIKDVMAIYP
jgi:hypothetical protein